MNGMNEKAMSTNGLRKLHDAIARALAADDASPGAWKPYGVRRFADWREWRDGLEAELRARGVSFAPITW